MDGEIQGTLLMGNGASPDDDAFADEDLHPSLSNRLPKSYSNTPLTSRVPAYAAPPKHQGLPHSHTVAPTPVPTTAIAPIFPPPISGPPTSSSLHYRPSLALPGSDINHDITNPDSAAHHQPTDHLLTKASQQETQRSTQVPQNTPENRTSCMNRQPAIPSLAKRLPSTTPPGSPPLLRQRTVKNRDPRSSHRALVSGSTSRPGTSGRPGYQLRPKIPHEGKMQPPPASRTLKHPRRGDQGVASHASGMRHGQPSVTSWDHADLADRRSSRRPSLASHASQTSLTPAMSRSSLAGSYSRRSSRASSYSVHSNSVQTWKTSVKRLDPPSKAKHNGEHPQHAQYPQRAFYQMQLGETQTKYQRNRWLTISSAVSKSSSLSEHGFDQLAQIYGWYKSNGGFVGSSRASETSSLSLPGRGSVSEGSVGPMGTTISEREPTELGNTPDTIDRALPDAAAVSDRCGTERSGSCYSFGAPSSVIRPWVTDVYDSNGNDIIEGMSSISGDDEDSQPKDRANDSCSIVGKTARDSSKATKATNERQTSLGGGSIPPEIHHENALGLSVSQTSVPSSTRTSKSTSGQETRRAAFDTKSGRSVFPDNSRNSFSSSETFSIHARALKQGEDRSSSSLVSDTTAKIRENADGTTAGRLISPSTQSCAESSETISPGQATNLEHDAYRGQVPTSKVTAGIGESVGRMHGVSTVASLKHRRSVTTISTVEAYGTPMDLSFIEDGSFSLDTAMEEQLRQSIADFLQQVRTDEGGTRATPRYHQSSKGGVHSRRSKPRIRTRASALAEADRDWHTETETEKEADLYEEGTELEEFTTEYGGTTTNVSRSRGTTLDEALNTTAETGSGAGTETGSTVSAVPTVMPGSFRRGQERRTVARYPFSGSALPTPFDHSQKVKTLATERNPGDIPEMSEDELYTGLLEHQGLPTPSTMYTRRDSWNLTTAESNQYESAASDYRSTISSLSAIKSRNARAPVLPSRESRQAVGEADRRKVVSSYATRWQSRGALDQRTTSISPATPLNPPNGTTAEKIGPFRDTHDDPPSAVRKELSILVDRAERVPQDPIAAVAAATAPSQTGTITDLVRKYPKYFWDDPTVYQEPDTPFNIRYFVKTPVQRFSQRSDDSRLPRDPVETCPPRFARSLVDAGPNVGRPRSAANAQKATFSGRRSHHDLERQGNRSRTEPRPSAALRTGFHGLIAAQGDPMIIQAATPMKLTEKLTGVVDYKFLRDFFLVYRLFMSPWQLARLLTLRFKWAMMDTVHEPEASNSRQRGFGEFWQDTIPRDWHLHTWATDPEVKKVIRLRTFVVFRHWLGNYFELDFSGSRKLRRFLATFLKELDHHPLLRKSAFDRRIAKALKKLWKSTCRRQEENSHGIARRSSQYSVAESRVFTAERQPRLQRSKQRSGSILFTRPGDHREQGERKNSAVTISSSQEYQTRTATDRDHAQSRKAQRLMKAKSSDGQPFESNGSVSLTTSSGSVLEQYPPPGSYAGALPGYGSGLPRLGSRFFSAATEPQRYMPMRSIGSESSDSLRGHKPRIAGRFLGFFGKWKLRQGITLLFRKRFPRRPGSRPNQGFTRSDVRPLDSLDSSLSPRGRFAEATYSEHHPSVSSPTAQHSSRAYETSTTTTYRGQRRGSIRCPSHKVRRRSSGQCTTDSCGSPGIATSSFHESSIVGGIDPSPAMMLLSRTSTLIAQQFAVIEQEILSGVSWAELLRIGGGLHHLFNGKSQPIKRDSLTAIAEEASRPAIATKPAANGPNEPAVDQGVIALIERFNMTCQWVASQVLSVRSLNQRARIIEKFIKVAHRCRKYNNFPTLMQIVLGLQSENVDRLKHTWARVSREKKSLFKELQEFTCPLRNFKSLRGAMKRCAEDENETGVPFVGLYLSDMVSNSELPSLIPLEKILEMHAQGTDPAFERPVVVDSEDGAFAYTAASLPPLPRAVASVPLPASAPERSPYVWALPYDRSLQSERTKRQPIEFELSGSLVNYQKFRNIASVIKLFQAFHNPDKLYRGFEVDMEVYHHCLFLRNVLDSETLTHLSEKCEGKRGSQPSHGKPLYM